MNRRGFLGLLLCLPAAKAAWRVLKPEPKIKLMPFQEVELRRLEEQVKMIDRAFWRSPAHYADESLGFGFWMKRSNHA